ncbi:MAG: hypothetical protein WDZ52_05720 [Pseudohongiellaceae bacterium]
MHRTTKLATLSGSTVLILFALAQFATEGVKSVNEGASDRLGADQVTGSITDTFTPSAAADIKNSLDARPVTDRNLTDTATDSGPALAQPNEQQAERSEASRKNADTRTVEASADQLEPRLSPQVFSVLEEVQRRQQNQQWEEALNEMNALYSRYDELSSFEQATLLNFYTNTLLPLEMWEQSISAFSLMLTIPDLRPDISSRATLSLGQLHARVGDSDTAIAYYITWLANPAGEARTQAQENRVRALLLSAQESAQESTQESAQQ